MPTLFDVKQWLSRVSETDENYRVRECAKTAMEELHRLGEVERTTRWYLFGAADALTIERARDAVTKAFEMRQR